MLARNCLGCSVVEWGAADEEGMKVVRRVKVRAMSLDSGAMVVVCDCFVDGR